MSVEKEDAPKPPAPKPDVKAGNRNAAPADSGSKDETQGWLSGLVKESEPIQVEASKPTISVQETKPNPSPPAAPSTSTPPQPPTPRAKDPEPIKRDDTEVPKPRKKPDPPKKTAAPVYVKPATGREMVTFYRSISIMISSGVPLFACFEFLAREGESKRLSETCQRISQRLVQGITLHKAASLEPAFFGQKAVRLMEVGFQTGSLTKILARLATDEEEAWELSNQLKSGLVYPVGIAVVATIAVMILPPLVLNDLLAQVVQLTAEPPVVTQVLMKFSAFISSPWVIAGLILMVSGTIFISRTSYFSRFMDFAEIYLWKLPIVGDLWRSMVAVRFLSVFSLTYDCGLPATHCMLLSASATGSKFAHDQGPHMKQALIEGATLRECFELGGVLPQLALESVEAGQQTGQVSDMLTNSAMIIKAELQSRIEAVAKLVEPMVLMTLGAFVGVFALGCLLPIIKLAEGL
jgi:type II secretory pathway component PulF